MKIDEALSLDCYEVVDAELAYDYYWSESGKIKDKRNFECASERCNAQITCANLDKLRQDMKVDPYFKAVSAHSHECNLEANLVKTSNLQKSDEIAFARANISETLPDIFELDRPPSHFEFKDVTVITNNSVEQEELKRRVKREASSNEPRNSKHYKVAALVSKYHKYKRNNELSHHYITIKGFRVSYEEMFVAIKDRDIYTLSDYPRIYFGKAFVDQVRNKDDYRINFSDSFILEGKKIRPSTYVRKNIIEEAFSKKLYERKIQQLSKNNYPAVYCFVFSKPNLKEDNGKVYINLNIKKMDYFDMREEI